MQYFKYWLFSLLSVFSFLANGQQVTVSPVPQSVVWGAKAFDNNISFVLNGATTADKDAVDLLKNNLTIGTSGIEIIIGEKGDANVQSFVSEIPAKKEGYYLNISPNKVVIAGSDEAGTFYGVQSFLQILTALEVQSVTIKDFPDVLDRGVVEGFYGNPFSHADRLSQFEFYGKNKLNAYIYGPKNDPYHGFGNMWREPYPTEDAQRIKELIDVAHKNKVQFIWAVHPGNNINWNLADSLAIVTKFKAMYDLGVRTFAVFFDDIGGIGTDPTKQAGLMNYITDEFVKKQAGVAPLILCPTQYNQAWSGGDYLEILGNNMYPEIRIMWTGKSVVRMIDKETMDWINPRIKRNAYIWLNYPVTDYVVDHLLMGPTYGNDKTIANQLSGFTANPMEYAEASKVSLYSIADYAWNLEAYDYNASWLRAMRAIMPENYEAFKIFCENNIDLGSTYHGLRRDNESAIFKTVADQFMNLYNQGTYDETQANALSGQFQSFKDASSELMNSTTNTPLITEITPWLKVFDIMGSKGISLVNMYNALATSDSVKFIAEYQKIDSLEKVQNTIRSRDFEGSIKAPYPKPANEVVAPFIKQLQSKMVLDYRRKFSYKTDIFPKILLDEGRYYIKLNGKYLTNENANASGGNPVFLNYRDTINPQRQEWTVTIDPNNNRYKIVNTQDNRYINEIGNFGTNQFYEDWNTYLLYRMNGKYAIQNAGSAGNKIWQSDGNRINLSNDNTLNSLDFIFEFVPISEEVNHPTVTSENRYFIKSGDKFLTNNNIGGTGGNPSFQKAITGNTLAQQWIFSIDNSTNRFKIVSAADNRYVNELGSFTVNNISNPFEAIWHTYIMTELGGLFSIQNAGSAGNNFWQIANDRISRSSAARSESFVFNIVNTQAQVPVKLVSFSATPQQEKIILNWQTATEHNSNYFTIDKSADGKNWQLLTRIKTKGNSNIAQNYLHQDESPIDGNNYYRLSETSTNGDTEILSVKTVLFKQLKKKLLVFPNPAKEQITIKSEKKEIASFYDSKGTLLFKKNIQQGNNPINISHLAAGFYIIKTEKQNINFVKK